MIILCISAFSHALALLPSDVICSSLFKKVIKFLSVELANNGQYQQQQQQIVVVWSWKFNKRCEKFPERLEKSVCRFGPAGSIYDKKRNDVNQVS